MPATNHFFLQYHYIFCYNLKMRDFELSAEETKKLF